MKLILISSSVALVIGFTFGWMFKSSSQESGDMGLNGNAYSSNSSSNQNKPTNQDNKPSSRPSEEIVIPYPDRKPFIPVTNNTTIDAKWHHLSSTLSLNEEQTTQIATIIDVTLLNFKNNANPLDALQATGEALEKSILASLDPEQQEAFRALQQRSLQNQISAKAMRFYYDELSDLDLTPAQRDQAIETIILEYQEKAESIPESSRLLLEGSFLPSAHATISDEGISILRGLGQSPTIGNLAEIRREQMYEMVSRFDNILTPAQIKIYEDKVRQSLDKLDKISPP